MNARKMLNRLVALYMMLIIPGCGGNDGIGSVQMGGAIQGKTIALTGTVTTLAGTASNHGSADGTGAAASFNEVSGLTTDGTNIYVVDGVNNIIRRITLSTGAVTTLAGTTGTSGAIDGTGSSARFNGPTGITTDGINLYITDQFNNTIRKIVISTGAVTTLAGTAGVVGSADGTGATSSFNGPAGITTDGSNIYVVDSTNSTIRKIVISSGVVTTLAGTAGTSGFGSTDGAGTAARFDAPFAITTDGVNLFVVDSGNSRTIRKISISTGEVTTLVGTAVAPRGTVDGTGAAARFYSPGGITSDGTNLFVPDVAASPGGLTIRRIAISTGAVTTINLTVGLLDTTPGSVGVAPFGVTTDGRNLYSGNSSNTTICKIQ